MGNPFSGISDAKTYSGTLPFMLPGSYVVTIDSVCIFQGKKKRVDYFKTEFTIEESSNPLRKVNSKACWLLDLSNPSALSDARMFLLACQPTLDLADIDENNAEWATGPDNPLRDTEVGLDVIEVELKGGGTFSRHQWRAI